MGILPVWIILLLLLCVAIGFALIKAPKVFFAILAVFVLAAVPLFYVRMGATFNPTAQSATEYPPLATQVRGPIIVAMDGPTTAPSTQPSGKPWVDDWQTYINSIRPNQTRLRAGTTSPWGSEEDARREARRQAAVVMVQRVAGHVRATDRLLVGKRVVSTDEWLLNQLQQSLWQGQFVLDEYVQRTEHPYGETWTCQVLLDASQPTIARAGAEYTAMARRQIETSAVTWGGLAALALVIVLLYAFLNSVTKGYFMWRLRAAAAMIVIIAVLVVISVA